MAEHVGMNDREIFDMGVIGVGEHVSGRRFAARASSGAMPGISPAKIAFHPSRNWASDSGMPSEVRKDSK